MNVLSDSIAMLRVKWQAMTIDVCLGKEEVDLRFCYDILADVSRSFSTVIKQLKDRSLRDGICIFYLVLRALDTIEDDMAVPVDVKLSELAKFYTRLEDLEWCLCGVGEGRERELLEQYTHVTRAYKKLRKEHQHVIADICLQMGNGMCEFLQRPVTTTQEYDLYCHYVAGLVGQGLTRLFASCGFADSHLAKDLSMATHMGLFLQKTNIIRDYYKDIREEPPRMLWPREIWGLYAHELKDFQDEENKEAAVRCLNAMVANAMQHASYVIAYMAAIREPSVFRFCAIPQIMAIATLAEVYNNARTFQVKVKMPRSVACRIMIHSTDLYNAVSLFGEYCERFLGNLKEEDASTSQLRCLLREALAQIEMLRRAHAPVPYSRALLARYPALGGRFLLSIVDNITVFFSGGYNPPSCAPSIRKGP